MPYQGSAQSIGFRNRTVIDPSKRMREEAAQIEAQGRERVIGMERQASQQIGEMRRVSDIQANNTRYELEALSQFSSSLSRFIEEDVVELEKKRIEGEIEEGKRLYAEQGPAFLSQQDDVKKAANRSYELDVQLDEVANKAPTEEAGERIRKLSRWQQHGWELAAMKEAGQGFGMHLDAELTSNETLIKDPNGGPDFKIKDYKGKDQYEAAVNYLQNEFIKNNNPAGLSAKVVNTVLIPQVDTATHIHRKQYYEQQKTEAATLSLETATVSLDESLSGNPAFPDPGVTVNGFLTQATNAYQRMGSTNPRKAAKDLLIRIAKSKAAADPGNVDNLIATLEKIKIKGHPAGEKNIFELYGTEISPNILTAAAIKQEAEDFDLMKKDQFMDADNEIAAYKKAVDSGLSGIQQNFALKQLESKYGIHFPDKVNDARSYSPLRYGVEQSRDIANALVKEQGGEITQEQLLKLDPAVASEFQKYSVDKLFTDGQKEVIKAQHKKLEGAVRSATRQFDTNTVLQYDALNALTAAERSLIPEAQKIFEAARAAGQPISQQQAIEMAGDRISEYIESGANNKDKSHPYYYSTNEGYKQFSQRNNPGISKAYAENERIINDYKNKARTQSNAAINVKLPLPPEKLELTANGLPDSIFFSLARLDGNHDAFEILNAQRAKVPGLAAVQPPKEAQSVQQIIKQYPELKPLFLSHQSYNRINRGMERISVSAPNLMKALGLQESGGRYNAINWKTGMAGNPAVGKYQILWKNVLAWSKSYGMPHPGTMDDFRNNPQYQETLAKKAFENYIQQAARRSDDPAVVIRMAAAAWYGGPGAMKHWNNPNYLGANPTDPNMQEYTSQVLEKYMRGQF